MYNLSIYNNFTQPNITIIIQSDAPDWLHKQDIGRGNSVSIRLELLKAQGGAIFVESLLCCLAGRIFLCLETVSDGPGRGAAHSKYLVSDGYSAFFTSANPTIAAMEWNTKTGILGNTRQVPVQLDKHLQALATIRKLILL